jgi:hypothetical protein
MSESVVIWPADCRPERCPVYACNELEMDVAPEVVWAWADPRGTLVGLVFEL